MRYATAQDVQAFNAASAMRSASKGRYREMLYNLPTNCKNFPCYYINNPIILPDNMFGSHASAFLMNPNINLPAQLNSHNVYIFLDPPAP